MKTSLLRARFFRSEFLHGEIYGESPNWHRCREVFSDSVRWNPDPGRRRSGKLDTHESGGEPCDIESRHIVIATRFYAGAGRSEEAVHFGMVIEVAVLGVRSTRKDEIFIKGDTWELWEITDRINVELMREAVQEACMGDTKSIRGLYIDAIAELIK